MLLENAFHLIERDYYGIKEDIYKNEAEVLGKYSRAVLDAIKSSASKTPENKKNSKKKIVSSSNI